jgi:hypothetical protein
LGFVHLHVHSAYSLLEGALTLARLAELAKADRQPALALTDTDNLFGGREGAVWETGDDVVAVERWLPLPDPNAGIPMPSGLLRMRRHAKCGAPAVAWHGMAMKWHGMAAPA